MKRLDTRPAVKSGSRRRRRGGGGASSSERRQAGGGPATHGTPCAAPRRPRSWPRPGSCSSPSPSCRRCCCYDAAFGGARCRAAPRGAAAARSPRYLARARLGRCVDGAGVDDLLRGSRCDCRRERRRRGQSAARPAAPSRRFLAYPLIQPSQSWTLARSRPTNSRTSVHQPVRAAQNPCAPNTRASKRERSFSCQETAAARPRTPPICAPHARQTAPATALPSRCAAARRRLPRAARSPRRAAETRRRVRVADAAPRRAPRRSHAMAAQLHCALGLRRRASTCAPTLAAAAAHRRRLSWPPISAGCRRSCPP